MHKCELYTFDDTYVLLYHPSSLISCLISSFNLTESKGLFMDLVIVNLIPCGFVPYAALYFIFFLLKSKSLFLLCINLCFKMGL